MIDHTTEYHTKTEKVSLRFSSIDVSYSEEVCATVQTTRCEMRNETFLRFSSNDAASS